MRPETVAKIRDELGDLLRLLINNKYATLAVKTGGVRLSAEDIRNAIDEYGRTIIFPPAEAFEQLDLLEVRNSNPKRYSLRFDLWTMAEGRSDLSLEITVIQNNTKNDLLWELDDIHVL